MVMNMKEKKLPSKKKKKEPEVKLSMADINKNSNIEVDHTIRKIKEKELMNPWIIILLFGILSIAMILATSGILLILPVIVGFLSSFFLDNNGAIILSEIIHYIFRKENII